MFSVLHVFDVGNTGIELMFWTSSCDQPCCIIFTCTIHPLVVFLVELSGSVPESVVGLLHVSDHLDLWECSHLPLQKLLLIVDGLARECVSVHVHVCEYKSQACIEPSVCLTNHGLLFRLFEVLRELL